jgi:DNA-binding CsgD family transcriptional regulator
MLASDALERGRAAIDREAWAEAAALLAEADRSTPLAAADLDRLATAAYLTGNEAASLDTRTRAHTLHLANGDIERAALSGLWIVITVSDDPRQQAVASGWLARVSRLLDDCPPECAARGRWLCATAFARAIAGDMAAAGQGFAEAARIGAAAGDRDLEALARQGVGRVWLRQRRTAEGLAALDEAMVAVTCGEVGPIIAGVVYCSVIGACHEVFDLRRAQEWTEALAGWCAAHPDMVPFRAPCLVRRSELLQLHGAWDASLDEARRACELTRQGIAEPDAGQAHYRLGDIHRLRGEFDAADAAYRRASAAGRKPDPGVALLRLAQRQPDAAVAGIRRALDEARGPRLRVDVLRAAVIIELAAGDLDAARAAAAELDRLAGELDAPFLVAAARDAQGSVAVAGGDLATALVQLHAAAAIWRQIDAPFELAATRARIARVYLARGDEDGARMEFEAAQETFERLGAAPDAARVAEDLARWSTAPPGGLTGREIEVLRLVATGRSNRAIATELGISEKTVARHISNIFTKLDLSSRAAATAYAYEHQLL